MTMRPPSPARPPRRVGKRNAGLANMRVVEAESAPFAMPDDAALSLAPLRDRFDYVQDLEIDPHAALEAAISPEPIR